MAVIIVTGTPGTGKSTVARLIEKGMGFTRIDVNAAIVRYNICDEYDDARRCVIVDVEQLIPLMIKLITDEGKAGHDAVVDSHMSHHIPKKYADLCIVTRCDLKTLQERLRERGYSEEKVRENTDAEIFENCLTEAEDAGHNVMVIDTTKDVDDEALAARIQSRLYQAANQAVVRVRAGG